MDCRLAFAAILAGALVCGLITHFAIETVYPTEITCNGWDYWPQRLSEYSTECKCRAFQYANAPNKMWRREWDTRDDGCPYSAARTPDLYDDLNNIQSANPAGEEKSVALAAGSAECNCRAAAHMLDPEKLWHKLSYVPRGTCPYVKLTKERFSMFTHNGCLESLMGPEFANSNADAWAKVDRSFTSAPSSSGATRACVTVGEDGQGEGAGKGGAVEIDGIKITQDGCITKQTRDGHPHHLEIAGGNGGHAYGDGDGGDGGEIKIIGSAGNLQIRSGDGGSAYGKGKAGKGGSVTIEGRAG